jgi:hypothetical protein
MVFVRFFLDIPQRIRRWVKRAFSPRVEDSVRLRALGGRLCGWRRRDWSGPGEVYGLPWAARRWARWAMG